MLNENTYFADHTLVKRVDTPWGDRCIEASYDGFDARLDGYKCVIVLDTVRHMPIWIGPRPIAASPR